MKSLSDLLKNHAVPGIREAEMRRQIAGALTAVTGISIQPKQVKYRDGIVSLSVPPVLKSALSVRLEEAKTLLEKEGVVLTEIR